MESRASEVLLTLKNPNASVDTKIAALTNLKSDIKQKNVPEAAVSPIFDSLRLSISAQHSSLSSAGFSTLGHLLKRLYIQEFHNLVAFHARHLYPICLERLGDHKERIRSLAAQAFTDLWTAAPQDVEQHVLGVALVGKNPRAKETSMTWLATMTREHNILFRAHVPSLVTALEDADSGVREAAKVTVIDIFQSAPSRAKSDLKKQLSENGVRKSIVSAILSSLGLSDHDTMSSSRSETRRPGSSLAVSRHRDDPPRPNSVLSARPQSRVGNSREDTGLTPHATMKTDKFSAGLSHSMSTDSLAASAAAALEDENIEPLDVDSNRDIDDMFRNMSYHFEGRESEQNWIPREKSVETLRKLVRGNAPHSFSQHFLAGIKNLLDGILKVANSLRTTLSTAGCLFIQDLARICGPGIDHMVEMLLQNMIKLCAGMKKISAQNANASVDIIIQNVTYVPRILQHIWFACQDKNTQPRQYATGWLKTLLNKQARHKSSIEHAGGLDVVEKCIKRGLADANPGVRESMRGTFWTFNQLWPDRADEIMSTLDAKSKSLLEKDPNNPNGTNSSDGRSRPGLSNSVSAANHRSTLKETIAAQKRAAAARSAHKSAPPRPESAQSTYAEAKPTRPASRAQASKPTGSVRTVPTGAHLSSLSSAPMRPGAKPRRPEIARPATADPYSDRRPPSAASHNKTFSPDTSPVRMRAKTPTTKSPGRPKSRAGGAPVSATTRSKPKRLDIASLKSNDPRDVAGPKSDPEDIAQAPLIMDEPFVPHSHEGTQAVELGSSDFVPEPMSAAAATENVTAPVEIQPFIDPASPEATPSRMQISHSRETSLESRGVSSVVGSPNVRHSRHSSEDHHSKIPSPVAPRSVNHNEARLVGLRVYEDPDAQKPADETVSHNEEPVSPDNHHPVLEEIPVNEPNTPAPRDNKQTTISPSAHVDSALPPDGLENGHRAWGKAGTGERRRSISPRSKDLTKAKEMIDKGIARIRAKALDVHGYRKLQGLIKYHGAIFTDQAKYNEMLLALLDALETASDEKRSSASRSMDLKTQILVTIRLMFAHNETYFAEYYPRVMTSLLNTRKQYELTTNHIVSGLEETAEDIVSSCQPQEVMTAVLDLVEAQQNDDEGYRAITMGIYVLSGLLRRLNKYQKKLSDAEISRLGQFGNASLSQPQPDVRRAVTEYCVELHEMMHDEEAFWRMINSTGNDHRNLLTYFIAKKSSEAVRS